MKTGRMSSVAVVVLAVGATLSGCASIPTTGPVQAGNGDLPFDEDLYPIPPQIAQDDPVRLVTGFVTASAAGVAGDFSDERGYLYGDVAAEWDPSAQVTIYGTGDLDAVFDPEKQTVSVSFPLAATVDVEGRMTEYEEGTSTTVTFGVTEPISGRWRISSLDDGIVISQASFDLVFRPVALAFGSRDGDVVVPELRWLPRRNIATHATLALIGGPSAWLEDAVVTGLSPTAELVVQAVPIDEGQADIALTEGSTGSLAERSLALEQILHTLLPLPDVAGVNVTVGALPIGGDGSVSLEAPPVPSSRAAVVTEGRLGVWDGEGLSVVDGGGRFPADARDVALAYDGVTVACVIGEGTLATAALPSDLVAVEDAAPATAVLDLTEVFEGEKLVAPSFDREGWLWTAEAEGAGLLHVIGPTGEEVDIRIPGMEGRNIGGIAVSHDGVRIAILSQEGGRWRLGVVALIRAEDGTPLSVGPSLDVGVGMGPSGHLSWIDEGTIAVLGSASAGEAGEIRLVTVGGRTEVIASPPDAVGMAARNGIGSIAVVTEDGSLYVRVSTQWSRVDIGASVEFLAFSG
ncbi:MAG: hypothetical protein JW722_03295 [Demequinaceae bacterium]|nr:hypothetical protein [Demequinaceae bacterium]